MSDVVLSFLLASLSAVCCGGDTYKERIETILQDHNREQLIIARCDGTSYDKDTAVDTRRLIKEIGMLQAIGLDMSQEEGDCANITHFVTSSHKIQSLARYISVDVESYRSRILDVTIEMTSLRQLWLTLSWTPPDDDLLICIADKVFGRPKLNSVLLISKTGDIMISEFLKTLTYNDKCLSTVYKH